MQSPTGWFSWAPETTADTAFYETCNIGYRRTVLEAVGGFDESFQSRRRSRRGAYVAPVWGEDTDLGLRAKAAGAAEVFAFDAIVWHDLKSGRFRDRLADLPRRAGTVALLKRHPELRREFAWRVLSQRGHAFVIGVLVGAVATGLRPTSAARWVVTAAAASAWVRERGAYYPRRAWPRVLPQWFVLDVVEVAVLTRASIRHRTMFL
jgi:hypothetical protein